MGATQTASEIDREEWKFDTRSRNLSSITASTSVVHGALPLVGLHRGTGPRIILLLCLWPTACPSRAVEPYRCCFVLSSSPWQPFSSPARSRRGHKPL